MAQVYLNIRKSASRPHQQLITIGIALYQRRTLQRAEREEKTVDLKVTAKKPRLVPTTCVSATSDDIKMVFFIFRE